LGTFGRLNEGKSPALKEREQHGKGKKREVARTEGLCEGKNRLFLKSFEGVKKGNTGMGVAKSWFSEGGDSNCREGGAGLEDEAGGEEALRTRDRDFGCCCGTAH